MKKNLKQEIERFVGKKVWIDVDVFHRYAIQRSHEIIKDSSQTAHDKRMKLKKQMRDYCKKLIKKNREAKQYI